MQPSFPLRRKTNKSNDANLLMSDQSSGSCRRGFNPTVCSPMNSLSPKSESSDCTDEIYTSCLCSFHFCDLLVHAGPIGQTAYVWPLVWWQQHKYTCSVHSLLCVSCSLVLPVSSVPMTPWVPSPSWDILDTRLIILLIIWSSTSQCRTHTQLCATC